MRLNPTQVGAAPICAAALGRALGVEVKFGPYETAFAINDSGRKVILMSLLPVELEKAVETLLWGFLHHEAGHLRHTDYEVLSDPALNADGLLKSLFFAIEDVRMERAHMALYPGAVRILSDLVSELVRIRFFAPPKAGDPRDAFFHFVLKHLRCAVLGQAALHDQTQFSRSILESAFGAGFVTRLAAILTRVLDATCTGDALDLALQVRQFLEDEVDARQNPPQPDDDASQASVSQGAGGDDGSSTPDPNQMPPDQEGDTSPTPPDPSSDDDGSKGDDGDPDDDATGDDDEDSGAKQSTQAAAPSDGDADNAIDALSSILKGQSNDDPSLGDLGEALGKLLNDKVEQDPAPCFRIPEEETRSAAYRDDRSIADARNVSTRLAVQLRRKLESENRVHDIPKNRGKRISRRHLCRVAFDDYRVFRSTIIGPEINTAVVTLLDVSSSMSGEPVRLASRAVLASALALDTIPRLAHAVAAFPGRRGDDFIELIKDFDEDARLISSRFAVGARHCTPLTEALLWAGNRLVTRPEERRVIYVATDGGPNHAPSAQQMIAQLHRMGTEVHGLGIGTDDPYGLFDSFARIKDVSSLPEAFMALSDRVLRRSA